MISKDNNSKSEILLKLKYKKKRKKNNCPRK